MSREADVGAAGVGEAAKDSRDELEDILKALEACLLYTSRCV